MTILALSATIIGLALWLGAAVFLTWFVGPVVTRRLSPGKATEIMELVSPRFYALGIGGASLMLVGGAGALFDPSIRTPTITFMAFTGVAMALSLYAGFVLLPRTDDLRKRLQSSAGSEENIVVRERYDQALRLANYLHYLVIFLLLGAAAALAALLDPALPPSAPPG
jgi:hypothetical protein